MRLAENFSLDLNSEISYTVLGSNTFACVHIHIHNTLNTCKPSTHTCLLVFSNSDDVPIVKLAVSFFSSVQ